MGGKPGPVGVLALQGDVAEHRRMLESLGCVVVEVRSPHDLDGLAGLVIPGGESTVMDKLTRIFGLARPLRQLIDQGMPVLGTCAGMIMLADRLEDAIAGQQTIGGLDVTVRRNAFGSQKESFDAAVSVSGIDGGPVDVSFIRAPIVTDVGAGVTVIATVSPDRIVGVSSGNIMALSFHPEVTGDDRLHRLFVDRVTQVGFRASSLPAQ